MKTNVLTLSLAVLICAVGCRTATTIIPQGGTAATVAAFSQDDIDDTISRAVQSILAQDRIKVPAGSQRAVLVIEDVRNDTLSRGRDSEALAEGLGQSLREELTNSGKVVVYNKSVAQYATVKVTPQYTLYGRLTQRNLRQDNSDIQIEYSLNLQLVELATGLEFWQKRIPLRKVTDKRNAM